MIISQRKAPERLLYENTVPEIKFSTSFDTENYGIPILSSKVSSGIFQEYIIKNDLTQIESFFILLLNKFNKAFGIKKLSTGTFDKVLIDVRQMFILSLNTNSNGFIVCHNHPSGNIKPSNHDLLLTEELKIASDIIGVNLIDHLIVSQDSYFSFNDEGLLVS